jgi:hypothetical protein
MRIVRKDGDHEVYQALLVQQIVAEVRDRLEEVGIAGATLRNLVEGIAFDVGAIVDGSASVSTDDADSPLTPILGFAIGRMRDRLLLPAGGGSSLHEFVPGAIEQAFGATD